MDTNVTHLQALGASRLAPSPRPPDTLPCNNSTNFLIFTVFKARSNYFIPFQAKYPQTILSSISPSASLINNPAPRPLSLPKKTHPKIYRRRNLDPFFFLPPISSKENPKIYIYRRRRRRRRRRRKMGAMVLSLAVEEEEEEEEDKQRRNTFSINDNVDLLVEILGRLDGRSLGVAACVCRLWSSVCRRDSVWEALCNRHVAGGGGGPGTRTVVAALGGYRRLYRLCVGPALDRLAGGPGRTGWAATREEAAHLSLSLSLSLFSIDCYERLGGPRQRPASLLFLCKPVNVS